MFSSIRQLHITAFLDLATTVPSTFLSMSPSLDEISLDVLYILVG